ncbi:PTS glucitol/sorbitol transporter subunit IIC [Phytohabitans rumicis]|uniref:PTS sorbitol transporter subunit IIC n=1 Tax=Phytohabitans rumicis TaxID=1076125 RepID=A0A6V8KY18_9ACTN|nr:PTS glucitol/sorbitol transporter subunit IIC [Phytohabitans rumicis]GFJ87219.1 PTS sorbitol transporter subunit IIC [Phytohabitans rumicis]
MLTDWIYLAEEGTPEPPKGVLGTLAHWAEDFIGVFKAGGETFVSLLVGIVPLLIILLTAVNALIRMIGPERIDRLGAVAARPGLIYYPLRYLVLPFLAVFFLTNPMAYTLGRFLPEEKKPAFYDSAVSFVHPILGIFPHANPGEYFVYGGIAAGITTLAANNSAILLGDLAVRYFLVGLLVIFIRGVVTEIITKVLLSRRARQTQEATA